MNIQARNYFEINPYFGNKSVYVFYTEKTESTKNMCQNRPGRLWVYDLIYLKHIPLCCLKRFTSKRLTITKLLTLFCEDCSLKLFVVLLFLRCGGVLCGHPVHFESKLVFNKSRTGH